jgi:hypothetical protein
VGQTSSQTPQWTQSAGRGSQGSRPAMARHSAGQC